MSEKDNIKIEKFFCNICKGETKHFIRGEHGITEDFDDGTSFTQRALIIECCGCEHLALVKKTHFSEHMDFSHDPISGKPVMQALWEEEIYPPVSYRPQPSWIDDVPDETLQQISSEIYKSLQSDSLYLATFGSRTLIERLIFKEVGDVTFAKGLRQLTEQGKISEHERDILTPVVNAGNAAAHRGWSANREQIGIILDTIEALIQRLLVLPARMDLLEDAPKRGEQSKSTAKLRKVPTVVEKIEAAPKELRSIYDELAETLKAMGSDVTIHPQKHYMAFRRNRNFASVQIYNQKKLIRVYLNLDPDELAVDKTHMRDVRQIGHFGTGDLEITIKSKKDIEKVTALLKASYEAS